MWTYNTTPDTDYLCHYGVLGMKWGRRRYQNEDGTLTSAGKNRYGGSMTKDRKDRANNSKTNNSSKNPKAMTAKQANKRTQNSSEIGERVFNTIKKGANAVLDKADNDNFFNNSKDGLFSESYMKRQSKIDRSRDFINALDYKTLKSSKGKQLIDVGKTTISRYLDDADDRDFFNKDWDTRMENEDRRDIIRKALS